MEVTGFLEHLGVKPSSLAKLDNGVGHLILKTKGANELTGKKVKGPHKKVAQVLKKNCDTTMSMLVPS